VEYGRISLDSTQSEELFFGVGSRTRFLTGIFSIKTVIGIYLMRGIHFTDAAKFNEQLTEAGYEPLAHRQLEDFRYSNTQNYYMEQRFL
jgi:hypothetical protein